MDFFSNFKFPLIINHWEEFSSLLSYFLEPEVLKEVLFLESKYKDKLDPITIARKINPQAQTYS